MKNRRSIKAEVDSAYLALKFLPVGSEINKDFVPFGKIESSLFPGRWYINTNTGDTVYVDENERFKKKVEKLLNGNND